MIGDRALKSIKWYRGKVLSHSDLIVISTDNKWYIIKNLLMTKATIEVKEFTNFEYYYLYYQHTINKTLE